MTFQKTPSILKGNSVTLRPINPEKDAPTWYEVMKDPEMHLWTGNTVPKNVDEIKQLLQNYNDINEIIAWAIVKNDNQEMIGTYWIAPMEVDRSLIIADEAQRIARKYWRKGYTREVRKLVFDYSFTQLGVKEIHAHAWSRNVNSCRSMKKAGFKLLECKLELFKKYNKYYQLRHYVLYREDWKRHVD